MNLKLLTAAALLLAAPAGLATSYYHRDVAGASGVNLVAIASAGVASCDDSFALFPASACAWGGLGAVIALDGSAGNGEADLNPAWQVSGTCTVDQSSPLLSFTEGEYSFLCGVDRDDDGVITNMDPTSFDWRGFDDDFETGSGSWWGPSSVSVCLRADAPEGGWGFDDMEVIIQANVPSTTVAVGAFAVDVALAPDSYCSPSPWSAGTPVAGAFVPGVGVPPPPPLCPSGITSPPGPGQAAVVCGVGVPNPIDGTDVRSCGEYGGGSVYPGQQGVVLDHAPDGPGGGDTAVCVGLASSCPAGGVVLNNAPTCLPNACPGGAGSVDAGHLAACGIGPVCPTGVVGTPGSGELARACGVGVQGCTGPLGPGLRVGVVACVGLPWVVVGAASPCSGTVNARIYWGTTPGFTPGSTSDVCF
jgi:hypothetical protein